VALELPTWKEVPAAEVTPEMLLPEPAETVPRTELRATPVVALFVLRRDESGSVSVACVTSIAGPPVASTVPTPAPTTIRRPALPV